MTPGPAAIMGELYRFHHAFDSYMTHAFPHDELKPLTESYTDSLGESAAPFGTLPLDYFSNVSPSMTNMHDRWWHMLRRVMLMSCSITLLPNRAFLLVPLKMIPFTSSRRVG